MILQDDEKWKRRFEEQKIRDAFQKIYSSEKNIYKLNDNGTVTIITNATTKHGREDSEPYIDNNHDLLMHVNKYKVTYDITNKGYFKTYLKGERSRLHNLIYEFFTGEKIDTSKYEIDHFNSVSRDNRFNNLLKIDKKLHDKKINLLTRFVVPYTINLKMNEDKSRFLVLLSDCGVRKEVKDEEYTFEAIYDYNYLLYLEYDNVDNLIEDLDLFKTDRWSFSGNEVNSIKKHVELINDEKYINDMFMKIRNRYISNKAIRIRQLKFTKENFNEFVNRYICSSAYVQGNSNITFDNIDNCLLDFKIFDMDSYELKEIGLKKIEQ